VFLGTICWLANLKRFSDGYLNFCLVARGAEVDLKGICRACLRKGYWFVHTAFEIVVLNGPSRPPFWTTVRVEL
jgi:hypothetical protein